jgi:hypothetical protein
MDGSFCGLACVAKKENPDVVTTHCFIHRREMLVSKTFEEKMKKFWMMLQKMLTLSNEDQFIPECLKTV